MIKKLCILVALTFNLISFAQYNCSVGNFHDVNNPVLGSVYGHFQPNISYGIKYTVTNPGTVLSLGHFNSLGNYYFKLSLYKYENDSTATFITSTAVISGSLSTYVVPVTPTHIDAGEYIIFLNTNTTENNIKMTESTGTVHQFNHHIEDDDVITQQITTTQGRMVFLNMNFICDPDPSICVSNHIDYGIRYFNNQNPYTYFVPFTITESYKINNFKVVNASDAGQFSIAVYNRVNGSMNTLVASSNITNTQVGIQTILPNEEVTLPSGDYLVGIYGDQLNHLNWSVTDNPLDVFYYFDSNDSVIPLAVLDSNDFDQSYGVKIPLEINFDCATAGFSDVDQASIKIYPNPAQDQIFISGLKEATAYTVFNLLGAKIKTGTVHEQNSIPVSHLAKGMYVIKLDGGQSLKFIKD